MIRLIKNLLLIIVVIGLIKWLLSQFGIEVSFTKLNELNDWWKLAILGLGVIISLIVVKKKTIKSFLTSGKKRKEIDPIDIFDKICVIMGFLVLVGLLALLLIGGGYALKVDGYEFGATECGKDYINDAPNYNRNRIKIIRIK